MQKWFCSVSVSFEKLHWSWSILSSFTKNSFVFANQLQCLYKLYIFGRLSDHCHQKRPQLFVFVHQTKKRIIIILWPKRREIGWVTFSVRVSITSRYRFGFENQSINLINYTKIPFGRFVVSFFFWFCWGVYFFDALSYKQSEQTKFFTKYTQWEKL